MTKRGSQDNVVTYEHYCDTKADLDNIPQDTITLGSVAIVLKDEGNEMGIYLANSNKEWISFSTGGSGGGSNMNEISLANLLDISLTNPTDGQTLVYNSETEKWENKESSNCGMVVPVFRRTSDDTTATCNMTFAEIVEAVQNNQCTTAKLFNYNDDSYARVLPLISIQYSGESYTDINAVNFSVCELFTSLPSGDIIQTISITAVSSGFFIEMQTHNV